MKLVCYRHGGATHYGAVKDNGKVVDLGTPWARNTPTSFHSLRATVRPSRGR